MITSKEVCLEYQEILMTNKENTGNEKVTYFIHN